MEFVRNHRFAGRANRYTTEHWYIHTLILLYVYTFILLYKHTFIVLSVNQYPMTRNSHTYIHIHIYTDVQMDYCGDIHLYRYTDVWI